MMAGAMTYYNEGGFECANISGYCIPLLKPGGVGWVRVIFYTNIEPGTYNGTITVRYGPWIVSDECMERGSFTEKATLTIFPADFDASPSTLAFQAGKSCRVEHQSSTITNLAPCGQAFTMQDDQPWLSQSARWPCGWWGCPLGAGESGEVWVNVSTYGLSPGNYSGTIYVKNKSMTKEVNVNLTVTSSEEVCDGIDNNCNGQIDEGCDVCEDKDGDGHYAISPRCPQGDDCNDSDAKVYPGAPEVCDGKDNNCNKVPDEGCCEGSVSVYPSEVWPFMPEAQRPSGYSEDWTKSTITISLTKPAPPGGCDINFEVEPVTDSGGHIDNGHTVIRPKGTVNSVTIPINAIEGKAEYRSSEVSGEERIIAKVGEKKVGEATIKVRVPGLYPMPGGDYRLTGQRTAHPDNHYGTYYTVVNTHAVAEDFYRQFNATLGINDMSLEWGGLFDIYGNWSPPHSSHRKGTSVDIDRNAQGPNGYIPVDRNSIEKICRKYSGHLIPEPTIHCEFPQ